MKRLLLLVVLYFPPFVFSQTAPAENLVLITLDGLRWQEVFRGLDMGLLADERFTEDAEPLLAAFQAGSQHGSAGRLLPFLHEVVFRQGGVIGNRDVASCARISNPWYFSYPGYSEILTGMVDPGIDSNSRVPNPNVSFLEWLNQEEGFRGKVAAFSSWDVFPWILNTERSGIPVNTGKIENPANEFENTLNRLYEDIPSPWATVRLDAFTHHNALSYLEREHPRLLYIAYGETDDFAHDGEYDQYLQAAHRSDRFIREVWTTLQNDPFYRDNTLLFITVDHGRGEAPLETWQHHASKESLQGYMQSLSDYEEGIVGSDQVWMAAMGPGIVAQGEIATGDACVESSQIAATLLQLLGYDYRQFNEKAGEPVDLLLESK